MARVLIVLLFIVGWPPALASAVAAGLVLKTMTILEDFNVPGPQPGWIIGLTGGLATGIWDQAPAVYMLGAVPAALVGIVAASTIRSAEWVAWAAVLAASVGVALLAAAVLVPVGPGEVDPQTVLIVLIASLFGGLTCALLSLPLRLWVRHKRACVG